MALPLAMTMRSTTSGGKPFATIQILPRAHLNQSSRAASASKVHDLSATEARVPHHRCAAERGQDALGHHRLEHEKQQRPEKPAKRAVTMRPFGRDVVAVEAAMVD